MPRARRTFPLVLITEALRGVRCDYDDAQIRADGYGGRGMYGDTCAGIDFDSVTEAFPFFAELGRVAVANEDHDDKVLETGANSVMELVECATTDGMRRGVIVYFPGWIFE